MCLGRETWILREEWSGSMSELIYSYRKLKNVKSKLFVCVLLLTSTVISGVKIGSDMLIVH